MVTKIVIDTNIFISVLIGKNESSTSRELFRRCLRREYRLLMGNALFNEYNDVMKRDSITELCPLTAQEQTKLLKAFLSVCQWVKVYYLWRPNLIDEADNHLIELAVAANAQIIATRNLKDLSQAQLKFPQLQILTPEQIIGV